VALGFKIADGYVEVHAKTDRDSIGRAARSAVGDYDREATREAEKRGKNGGILKALFTPNKEILETLTRPIGKIFSVPALFIAAALFATTLSGLISTAIVTGLLTGLSLGFIGLGIFALRANKQIKKEWDSLTKYMSTKLAKLAEPLIGPIIKGIGTIKSLFDQASPSLGRIFEGVAPMIDPLIRAFGGLLVNILPGIERALPGIQTVVEALAEHLPGLGTAIGDFFATIAENKELLTTVVGLMITWLDNFFKVLGPILVFLMMSFAGWGLAWSQMTEKISAFMTWWGGLNWGNIFGKVWDALATLGANIRSIWDGIQNYFMTEWNELLALTSSIWNGIHTAIGIAIRIASNIIAGVLGNIRGLWTSTWNGIHTVIAAIWSRIGSTISAGIAFGISIIRGFVNAAIGAINGLGGIPGRVGAFFASMFNQANAQIQRLLGILRAVPGNATRAIGNLGSVLYNAGRNLINGLINGVRAAIGQLQNILGGITSMIPDWKGPMEKDRRLLEPTGKAIMGSLIRGIKGQIGSLAGMLGGVTVGIPKMAMAGVPSPNSTPPPASAAPTTNSYGGNTIMVSVANIAELRELIDFMDGKPNRSTRTDRWSSTIYNENAGYQRSYQ
jgi:phage-related protein